MDEVSPWHSITKTQLNIVPLLAFHLKEYLFNIPPAADLVFHAKERGGRVDGFSAGQSPTTRKEHTIRHNTVGGDAV